MDAKNKLVKADFICSILFLALGAYLILEGLAMPGAGGFIEAGGEPGRVPVMVGAVIVVLAFIMLLRSSMQQGWQVWTLADLDENERSGVMRTVITAVGCSCYALGVIGASIAGWKLPYFYATSAFVFVYIVGFEWQQTETKKALYRLVFMAFFQAIIVTALIVYLFEQKFFVVLP